MSVINQVSGVDWTMFHGDCCRVLRDLPDRSIDLCVHSPPFSTLYIYSDSEADMGNCVDDDEFFRHYRYAISELYRVMSVGRLVVVHCKDLPRYANRDGTSGLIDFPGRIIREFEAEGFSFHSRVTIWKCPVLERERTNNNGLLHKTIVRDRSQVRQGLADYLVVMRKPPVGTLMADKPIVNSGQGLDRYIGDVDPRTVHKHPSPYARTGYDGRDSIVIWRRYAEPVWWDIDQTDVLNYKLATEADDEKHICPLQMGVIERSIDLWSMPGEVVLSPFAGIGSEGVGALRLGRKFVGIELKESYFRWACNNLASAERYKQSVSADLFAEVSD